MEIDMKRTLILLTLCSLGAAIYAERYTCGPLEPVIKLGIIGPDGTVTAPAPQKIYNSLEECKANCMMPCLQAPETQ